MFIEKIISQYRRDFTAVYTCEHCGYSAKGGGYDDANFHENVVPSMMCPQCNEQAGPNYTPLEPKYKPWDVV